jgi:hypothetical protein
MPPSSFFFTYTWISRLRWKSQYVRFLGWILTTTFLKIFFKVIFYFNTQTMHIQSFYTQQYCYVSLKTLYPGGIRARVFSFLRRIRCPLRHAARAISTTYNLEIIWPVCKQRHILKPKYVWVYIDTFSMVNFGTTYIDAIWSVEHRNMFLNQGMDFQILINTR